MGESHVFYYMYACNLMYASDVHINSISYTQKICSFFLKGSTPIIGSDLLSI